MKKCWKKDIRLSKEKSNKEVLLKSTIFLLLLAVFPVKAQNIIVFGRVKDSLQTPLDCTNILTVPESDNKFLN